MSDSPLVLIKIEPPRLRPGHVPRRDLVERLRHGLHRRLNLVAAPAGWGKTTLLAEWLSVEDEVAFAWVSVDENDNDPARFWAYVAAALRKAGVDVPPAFEAAVSAPGIHVIDAALPVLVNALVGSDREHVLVLDDYQLISDPEIHAGVRFLIARLSLTSHLVIATRVEPPVEISRLRARGELGEILSDHLRFSDAEAAALLNDTLELALGPDELQLLSTKTEGWAAALYLAGLSLRDRAARAVADDREFDRHLVAYLGDEVLAAQEAHVRQFLLDTCVLDDFSAGCATPCGARTRRSACSPRSSRRTSSSSRSTAVASGSVTTTSSGRCCAASWPTRAPPNTEASSTRARATGSQPRATSRSPSRICSPPGGRSRRPTSSPRPGTKRCRAGAA